MPVGNLALVGSVKGFGRERVGDGGEHGADQAFGVSPGHRRPGGDVRDEFVLVHRVFPVIGGGMARSGARSD